MAISSVSQLVVIGVVVVLRGSGIISRVFVGFRAAVCMHGTQLELTSGLVPWLGKVVRGELWVMGCKAAVDRKSTQFSNVATQKRKAHPTTGFSTMLYCGIGLALLSDLHTWDITLSSLEFQTTTLTIYSILEVVSNIHSSSILQLEGYPYLYHS